MLDAAKRDGYAYPAVDIPLLRAGRDGARALGDVREGARRCCVSCAPTTPGRSPIGDMPD